MAKIPISQRKKLDLTKVTDRILVELLTDGPYFIFGEAELVRLDKILANTEESEEKSILKRELSWLLG